MIADLFVVVVGRGRRRHLPLAGDPSMPACRCGRSGRRRHAAVGLGALLLDLDAGAPSLPRCRRCLAMLAAAHRSPNLPRALEAA